MDNGMMNEEVQGRLLLLMREAHNRLEATDWFRVALGLVYLASLMTTETIDFKKVDRAYNRFIYHTLGKGHSIASVLQFMSGEKVMPTVGSARFVEAFGRHCPQIPPESIPFLLELNLGVAKNISGLEASGPLADWVAAQKAQQAG